MKYTQQFANKSRTLLRDRRVQLTGILLFALLLRLWFASTSDLWLDETFSVVQSAKPIDEVLTLYDNTPPLFYGLLHFWMKLGQGELFVRLLPILLGVSVVAILWVWNEYNAAVLLAVWPALVEQHAEVRAYSLLILAVVIHFLLAQQQKERPIAGFFVALFSVFSHIYGIFSVLAANIVTWRKSKQWYTGQVVAISLWLVWGVWKFLTLHDETVSWIPLSSFSSLKDTVSWLTMGSAWSFQGQLFLWIVVVLLVLYGRKWKPLMWAFLPILVGMVIGMFIPFYTPKYVIPSVAGFAMSVRRVPWQAMSAFVVLAILATLALGHTERHLPWEEIASEERPIYFSPAGAVYPLLYYGERSCLGAVDEYRCLDEKRIRFLNGRKNPCKEDEQISVVGLGETPELVVTSGERRLVSWRQELTIQELDCSEVRGPLRSVR